MGARLFGEGLPGGGAPVQVRWFAGRLELDGDGLAWTAGVGELAPSGVDGAALRVDLDAPRARGDAGRRPAEGLHALVVDGAERAALEAAAGGALALARARPGGRAARPRGGWTAVAGAALLVVLALAGGGALLARSDALARWVVDRVPVEVEARLGELLLARAGGARPLQREGPAVASVRALGERLVDGSAHRYTWLVAEDQAENAFAMPGGVVVVTQGLIDAAPSQEELAGVVAHEVAHVELRHGLRAAAKSLGLRALAGLILGDAGGAVAAGSRYLTELKYSRDAEREADAEAVRRLAAAGIDPSGLVRFLERMDARAASSPPALLSTHPDTRARVESLRARIAALGGGVPGTGAGAR